MAILKRALPFQIILQGLKQLYVVLLQGKRNTFYQEQEAGCKNTKELRKIRDANNILCKDDC